MNGVRTEHPHYTDEQVRAHLRDTLAILDDLAVPDDLRVEAFGRVFAALSMKQIAIEAIAPQVGVPLLPRGA